MNLNQESAAGATGVDEFHRRVLARLGPFRSSGMRRDFSDTQPGVLPGGKLADPVPPRHVRKPHLPSGCDQQGRHPEAAECCTEVGAEPARRLLRPAPDNGSVVMLGRLLAASVVMMAGAAALVLYLRAYVL